MSHTFLCRPFFAASAPGFRRGRPVLLFIALAAFIVCPLGVLGCDSGKPSQERSEGKIAEDFWGYWTEASTTEEWYISDSSVTDPRGMIFDVKSSGASVVVVHSGSTQYSLEAMPSGLMKVSGASGAKAYLYKRNGSDAAFSARLEAASSTGASLSAFRAASEVSLVLQNVLNRSNSISARSDARGLVTVPAKAIAGDEYYVYQVGIAAPISVIRVSEPASDAGAIIMQASSLGVAFKASIKGASPVDFRYPDSKPHDLVLAIKNTGAKPAFELTYSLESPDPALMVLPSSSAGLFGRIPSLGSGESFELPISVSLGSSADFGNADYLEPAIGVKISVGGEIWTDRASIRFYRERRYIRFYADNFLSGFLKGPDGIAIGIPPAPQSVAAWVMEVPFRSKPYEAFLFPDLSRAIFSGGRIKLSYGALLSADSSEPKNQAPFKAVYGQPGMSYGFDSGSSAKPEDWYFSLFLNDGNEPNETLGDGPIIHRGGSFHGYLTEGDFDSYSLDFSELDPLAETNARINDFVFSFPGQMSDRSDDPRFTIGDGDGRIDPDERVFILVSIKTRLDPLGLKGWGLKINADTKSHDGVGLSSTIASGGDLMLTDRGVDLASLFSYSESGSATNALYATERVLGVFLTVPKDTAPRADSLANKKASLVFDIFDPKGLYASYPCEVPINFP